MSEDFQKGPRGKGQAQNVVWDCLSGQIFLAFQLPPSSREKVSFLASRLQMTDDIYIFPADGDGIFGRVANHEKCHWRAGSLIKVHAVFPLFSLAGNLSKLLKSSLFWSKEQNCVPFVVLCKASRFAGNTWSTCEVKMPFEKEQWHERKFFSNLLKTESTEMCQI